jgi:hypothetical protein
MFDNDTFLWSQNTLTRGSPSVDNRPLFYSFFLLLFQTYNLLFNINVRQRSPLCEAAEGGLGEAVGETA